VSQRAALYTVAVRRRGRGGGSLPLGDLDGAGTSLLSVLSDALDGFTEASGDGMRVVRSVSVRTDGDDLFAVVQHGRSGVAADIVGPGGDVRLRQTPADVQLVRYGCLLRLPAGAATGLLAIHVHDGRGMKELLEQGLVARFRARFPDLTLAIERLVETTALSDAVAGNRVVRLELAIEERPGERKLAATSKWVAPGVPARVELRIAARADGRIEPASIRRFLDGDGSAFAGIVEFAGITFERARVEVLLADGTRRLIDLARPDAGHAVTRALPSIALDADGEPTDESLLASLRAALSSVGDSVAPRMLASWNRKTSGTTSGSRPSGSSRARSATSPVARTTS
jgi:hypothetical protein